MQGTQGGWVALTSLNLSNNTLTGTLPADWDAAAAMPVMQVQPACQALIRLLTCSLQHMQGLVGAERKGAVSGCSVHCRVILELDLKGSCAHQLNFPSAYSSMLHGYPQLHLVCALRPHLAAQTLTLSHNRLTGTLQLSWGSSIAWTSLVSLGLSSNQLNGSFPPSWGSAGTLPGLSHGRTCLGSVCKCVTVIRPAPGIKPEAMGS